MNAILQPTYSHDSVVINEHYLIQRILFYSAQLVTQYKLINIFCRVKLAYIAIRSQKTEWE
jgi:hypothetical protein